MTISRQTARALEDGLYISTYVAPPGARPGAGREWVRHDQNVSAWLKQGRQVELLAVWELERLSGRTHHGLAVRDTEAFHELLEQLLHGCGLRMADVRDIWGTPGLGSGAHQTVMMAHPDLPYHSRCHLLGGMLAGQRPVLRGHGAGSGGR